MSTTASLNNLQVAGEASVTHGGSAIGLVAGTVLRAARLSSRLTQAELGAVVGAGETAIAVWEDTIEQLAAAPYAVIERLETALMAGGADAGMVADLTIAIWCDLVIAAVGESQEDVTCLMADPIAGEAAFSELLAWSSGGHRPARYRPYADPGPLLRHDDVKTAAETIRQLSAARQLQNRCAA